MNKGYAFVHFGDATVAQRFRVEVEGKKLPNSQTSKFLSASVASYQGAAVKPKKGVAESQMRNFSQRVWSK